MDHVSLKFLHVLMQSAKLLQLFTKIHLLLLLLIPYHFSLSEIPMSYDEKLDDQTTLHLLPVSTATLLTDLFLRCFAHSHLSKLVVLGM